MVRIALMGITHTHKDIISEYPLNGNFVFFIVPNFIFIVFERNVFLNLIVMGVQPPFEYNGV